MAKQRAKKRLPERPCPRGAEDSNLIRERLDGWRLGALARGAPFLNRAATYLYSKRTAGILANGDRFVVRRKAISLASPVQTQPHGSFVFSRSEPTKRLGLELLGATRSPS
jgi:hypothetical protein